jgi:hypothetical protein
MSTSANIAVVQCSGSVRQKLPYVQAFVDDDNWAGSGKAAFISLSGLSGQRLLTESQAGA